MNKLSFIAVLAFFFAIGSTQIPFAKDQNVAPDILILGDSQIAFGAGSAYLKFFQNLKKHCAPPAAKLKDFAKLGAGSVGVIGVRSAELKSWIAKSEITKNPICRVDPNWNVNAGVYGSLNNSGEEFIQIGKGEQYQFCKKNKSPFEALFSDGFYDPKLLILSYLGNSTREWAKSPETAFRDVRETILQLPPDLPCVFMTTIPTYTERSVNFRLKAQKNLRKAFEVSGNRCAFVEGLNATTIAENLGNKRHFKRRKNGKGRDPFHPKPRAARKFFMLEKERICEAVLSQLVQHKRVSE